MKQLLLIDDEEGIREIWQRFHDYAEPVFRGSLSMDLAANLEEGKRKLAEKEYDAVILDLNFKGEGSDTTVDFILKEHDALPPIIVLTGDEDIYVRRRCMVAGASDFWTKTDAQERPDLFFKALYNKYLGRYGERKHA